MLVHGIARGLARHRGTLGFAAALLALGGGRPVRAQTGEIAGSVADSTSKAVLKFANVTVVDTRLGANTQMDGAFRIRNVPPGRYRVRASYVGYEPRTDSVTVTDGQVATLNFRLPKKSAAGTTKKIVVLDTRPLVDVAEISTVRSTRSEDIAKLTVDQVADVVTRQVGVAGQDDQIHIRGGRVDETLFRIESVAMKNAVTGAPVGGTLSAKAVQEVQVITGGYQAEYGQAISGVVDIELKEAGTRWKSEVEAQAGSFDTQRLFLQTEAPLPGKAGFLVGLDLLSTDTYLPSSSTREATDFRRTRRTLHSNYSNSLLGVHFDYDDFMRLRQKNSLNAYAKLSWKPALRHKLNLTFTKFVAIDHGFGRVRVGDEIADASSDRGSYPWAYRYALDQYPTFTEETNSQVASWKFALSDRAFLSCAVSHFFNNTQEAVQGKRPWENPDSLQTSTFPDTFYVRDKNGEYPTFQDQFADRWSINGSYTRRWRGSNEFKTGVEASYHSLQMIEIRNPAEGFDVANRPTGLGSARDLYRVHPNEGAFYAQNQFRYQGFVGHAGMRADYMFLGEEADTAVEQRRNGMPASVAQSYLQDTHSLFGNRYKIFWSPRLGINHPITERDEMHFNFGHFIQWPRLIYYFAKIGSQSSEAFPLVGNLNLDPQRSVQVEFGVKHQFSDNDAVDVIFFNKDVYDYPTATRPIEAAATRLVYVNDDFSRTRGIELQVKHRATKRWGGNASYEYQIATGKPADPNRIKQVDPEALETGEAEPDLTEQFMPWNRPHRLQVNLDYRFRKGDRPKLFGITLLDDWGANLFYTLRSGRPYTPTDIRGTRIGKRNSKNAPFENVVDLKLDKRWRKSKSTFGINFEVRNLLDADILRVIDSNTGEKQEIGRGRYTVITGGPLERLRTQERLRNPSFYGEGRNLRLGLEVSF